MDKIASMTEGVCDKVGIDDASLLVLRVRVEVAMDRSGGGSLHLLQAEADPSCGFAWAQDGIVGRFVADLFATDHILLVIEFQRGELERRTQWRKCSSHSKVREARGKLCQPG